MFISGVLVWLGCLLVYMTSKNQKLMDKPLRVKFSYPISFIALLNSWVGFSQEYSNTIAAIVVLSLVMVMWSTIVLFLGHIKTTFIPFFAGGSVVTALMIQLGGVS